MLEKDLLGVGALYSGSWAFLFCNGSFGSSIGSSAGVKYSDKFADKFADEAGGSAAPMSTPRKRFNGACDESREGQ